MGLSGLLGRQLTGDWGEALKKIGSDVRAGYFLQKAKQKAIRRATAHAVKRIILNLRSSGADAGAQFQPLADSTVARRKKGKGKGGHKPLIDTGDLVGSVRPIVFDENTGFAGIKRGAIGKKSGEPRADIAMVHEFGAIRKPTEGAMHVVEAIPARPFVRPVLEKFAKEIGEEYARTMEKEFNEGRGPEPEIKVETT